MLGRDEDIEIPTIAEFRLMALAATDKLQKEIGFGNEWRALVENTIFDLMKEVHLRHY